MALKVINLDTLTLGDRSYIAHDGKIAVVVDPQRDIDRVHELIGREGVEIGAVVETHMHNDYVSGGLVLAREHEVPYIVNAEDHVGFERFGVTDSQVIPVGSFAIQALHTPGHTFTHMSYALFDASGQAQGVFTGGSMLHGSTGRTDLLGWEHAATLAGLQHSSAHRLVELLDDGVAIHPTHGFGSFCAATTTSGDSSTIADEKRTNPALLLEKEIFIAQTLAGLDAFPAYYKHMSAPNHAGAGPIDLSELPQMSTEEILRAIGNGAWVVDLRNRTSWAAAHVPGTISFGLDGSFATYLGWIFPYEKNLVLISDQATDVAAAQRELVRIGIDRPAGTHIGDIQSFGETASTKTVTFVDVPSALADPVITVLDIRRNSERSASHIEGTLHIPFHELPTRFVELPQGTEIWVHCGGAYRAAAAVGILEKTGRNAVLINEPYDASLSVASLNIVVGSSDVAPVAASDVNSKA